MTLSTC